MKIVNGSSVFYWSQFKTHKKDTGWRQNRSDHISFSPVYYYPSLVGHNTMFWIHLLIGVLINQQKKNAACECMLIKSTLKFSVRQNETQNNKIDSFVHSVTYQCSIKWIYHALKLIKVVAKLKLCPFFVFHFEQRWILSTNFILSRIQFYLPKCLHLKLT